MEARKPLEETMSPRRNQNALNQVTACDSRLIWRTRSLDEATRPSSLTKGFSTRQVEPDDESNESTAVAALHTSFDAALLEADRDRQSSIFRRQPEQDAPPLTASWDDSDPAVAADLRGRKHVRQPSSSESAGSFQPGTVRKLRRRAVYIESAKTPARPNLPQGSWKKAVPSTTPSSSSRRRRTTLKQRSPMRRVPPSMSRESSSLQQSNLASAQQLPEPPLPRKTAADFSCFVEKSKRNLTPSLTPTRPQTSVCLPTTVKAPNRVSHIGINSDCGATQDTDSVGTTSPAGATFRFTSFPASLPRVNNPRSATGDRAGSDFPRRRITDYLSGNPQQQIRDDDGTHNTSISSLSGDAVVFYQQHAASAVNSGGPPPMLEWKSPEDAKDEANDSTTDQLAFAEPVHSKLFLDDDMYGYSDDDSSDVRVRGPVSRTRLNFNLLLSSEDKGGFRDGVSGKAFERANAMDLTRPIEQKRVSSFPSSVSSSSPLRTLPGCDDITTASTSALTPSRSGVGSVPNDHADQPGTPRDVQLHFQLSSAQCSPIFSLPDETDAQTNGLSAAAAAPNSCQDTNEAGAMGDFASSNQDQSHSFNDSRVSGGSGKMRRLRPMPDISAFEHGVGADRSGDDSTVAKSRGQPSPPRLLCPPTPVRTPAWAHNDSFGNGLLPRANSLIISKVLATCPPRVLDKRCSLEISLMDDENGASRVRRPHSLSNRPTTAMMDDDSEASTVVETPESPVSAEEDDDPVIKTCCPVFDSAGEKTSSRFPFFRVDSRSKRMTAPQTPRNGGFVPPVHSSKLSTEQGNAVISFVSDFEVLGELGRGAFADVYKVRSKSDDRLYAVKRNRRQFRGKRDRDLALLEVQIMQRLQNVCSGESKGKNSYSLYLLFFYRAWQEDGHFFSQTELCYRDTCREMLQSLRSMWPLAMKKYPSLLKNLPPPAGVEPGSAMDTGGRLVPNITVWKICHDVAAGLSHIHSHGIVHNDIKPSNIFFVDHVRFGAMCKIGDFGMAGDIGTAEDGQEGDTMYMPPELLSSVVKQPGIDIFSLGLTLYEVASTVMWELPADGPFWHQLRSGKHVPELPTTREPELSQLIRSMIDPEPQNRPSAEKVLNSSPFVVTAGAGCDVFLQDYLQDVESFDQLEENRRRQEFSVQQDQTPRNALASDRRVLTIRSPGMAPLAPFNFSPKVVGIK